MSIVYARAPRTRVMLPLNGQLDANGNGTLITDRFPSGHTLSLVNVSLKVKTGTATWTVYVTPSNESGDLVGFVGAGVGTSVGGGPYPVAPNEFIQVIISGGDANAIVSGSVYGVQGVPIDDLPVVPSSSMLTGVVITTGKVSVSSADVTLGSLTQSSSSGGTASVVVSPSAGMKSLIILNTSGSLSRIRVIGNQTGATYYDQLTPQIPASPVIPLVLPYTPQAVDTTYTVSITYAGIGGASILGSFSVLPPFMQEVDTQFSLPAPWQGPTANNYQELAASGTATVIAGIAGQTIRIFGYSIELEATATSIAGFLQDTVRTSPANRVVPFGASANTDAMTSGNRGGDPLPVGAGLVLNYAVGTGNVRASVGYSQG